MLSNTRPTILFLPFWAVGKLKLKNILLTWTIYNAIDLYRSTAEARQQPAKKADPRALKEEHTIHCPPWE